MFTLEHALAIVKPHHDRIIAEGKVEGLERENARLRVALNIAQAALDIAIEFLEDRCDVVDGSYGESAPNREMSVLNAIKSELGETP